MAGVVDTLGQVLGLAEQAAGIYGQFKAASSNYYAAVPGYGGPPAGTVSIPALNIGAAPAASTGLDVSVWLLVFAAVALFLLIR